jgi:glycosyltransferase involved in cell wall biosynthesis
MRMCHYCALVAGARVVKVVQVNYAFDSLVADPDALLERYHTLTGWSEALLAAGIAVGVVQVFTRDADIDRDGVRYAFRRATGLDHARSVHRAVVGLAPDLVHVNGLDAPLRTWLLRQALPSHVALVVQDHGGAPPPAWTPTALVRRLLGQAPDAYLFTSREQAEPWLASGCLRKADSVYDVLEASTRLRPVDRQEARTFTRITGQPALLSVGRLVPVKDPLTVLDGFERSLESIPNAALTMVYGDDELLGEVRSRVDASPWLRDRVVLKGAMPHADLARWYTAADLFVLGSRYESAGYALVEACACGTTPVVTDIAPFKAITGTGDVGIHWRVGDAQSCAHAIVRASRLDLEVERRRVLDHFERHLSWAAVGSRARSIYRSIIEQRGGQQGGAAATGPGGLRRSLAWPP